MKKKNTMLSVFLMTSLLCSQINYASEMAENEVTMNRPEQQEGWATRAFHAVTGGRFRSKSAAKAAEPTAVTEPQQPEAQQKPTAPKPEESVSAGLFTRVKAHVKRTFGADLTQEEQTAIGSGKPIAETPEKFQQNGDSNPASFSAWLEPGKTFSEHEATQSTQPAEESEEVKVTREATELKDVRPGLLKNASAKALKTLQPTELSYLSADQIKALLENTNLSSEKLDILKLVKPETIAQMNVSNIKAEAFKLFTPEQIKALTPKQLKVIFKNKEMVRNLDTTQLTSKQLINTFTGENAHQFGTYQEGTSNWSPEQAFRELFMKLTKSQARAIMNNKEAWNSFSAEQQGAIKARANRFFDTFGQKTKSDEHYNNMTRSKTGDLLTKNNLDFMAKPETEIDLHDHIDTSNIATLSQDRIASLGSKIEQLDAATIANLSQAQVAALKPKQITALLENSTTFQAMLKHLQFIDPARLVEALTTKEEAQDETLTTRQQQLRVNIQTAGDAFLNSLTKEQILEIGTKITPEKLTKLFTKEQLEDMNEYTKQGDISFTKILSAVKKIATDSAATDSAATDSAATTNFDYPLRRALSKLTSQQERVVLEAARESIPQNTADKTTIVGKINEALTKIFQHNSEITTQDNKFQAKTPTSQAPKTAAAVPTNNDL